MKVSPLNRYRMTGMISNVHLSGNMNSLSKVKPVDRISSENTLYEKNNEILGKENFYNKLESETKKIEERENKEERKRENKISREISKENKDALEFVKEMIHKFNLSIDRVKKIDLARNESNYLEIKKVVNENSRFLNSLGISLDKLAHLKIDEDVFLNEIIKHPDKIMFLLEPSSGVVRKLVNAFGKKIVL